MNFLIPYVIYPFEVKVFIKEPKVRVLKDLEKYLTDEDYIDIVGKLEDEDYDARAIMTDGGYTILLFKDKPSAGTIAHECFHAITFLFKRLGITLTEGSDEAWAYLLEYLVDQINIKIKQK
jgi:hypothetical protein